MQLKGLPYVGIVIAGDLACGSYRVLQHMPGRRAPRLLASVAPAPKGAASGAAAAARVRVSVSAGVDAAFAALLAVCASEAAARGAAGSAAAARAAVAAAARAPPVAEALGAWAPAAAAAEGAPAACQHATSGGGAGPAPASLPKVVPLPRQAWVRAFASPTTDAQQQQQQLLLLMQQQQEQQWQRQWQLPPQPAPLLPPGLQGPSPAAQWAADAAAAAPSPQSQPGLFCHPAAGPLYAAGAATAPSAPAALAAGMLLQPPLLGATTGLQLPLHDANAVAAAAAAAWPLLQLAPGGDDAALTASLHRLSLARGGGASGGAAGSGAAAGAVALQSGGDPTLCDVPETLSGFW